MGRPVALVGHHHTCPIHGGGPALSPGQTLVRFNGIPLAVEGCICGCPGSPPLPDPMMKGSSVVKINGRGLMRVGDLTAHGGKIATGSPMLKSE